jgi:radical SAM protein with 4Fe4S-binding SPASM domain
MYCPRLDHNVRINPDGTVSKCGHMVHPPKFRSYQAMQSSKWLAEVADLMSHDAWPTECYRCQVTEQSTGESIRTHMLQFEKTQPRPDWLMVGGVLDNVCNSACQTCNSRHSTKIADLEKSPVKINNISNFWALPQDRITHLDISGGEPSYSKNYKEVLANLPPNVKSIRLNTNCSTVLKELTFLALKGIKITVTVSFDGVGLVHDYVRWPIEWNRFQDNLMMYKDMPVELNLWTTVSALNINNMPEIMKFVTDNNFDHSWSALVSPSVLDIRYSNSFTQTAGKLNHPAMAQFNGLIATQENNQAQLDAYITQQDTLRGISIKDYL